MDAPLLSFVILTHNRCEQVVRTIASVEGQRCARKEIIVVDNGSSNGTAESLRSRFPQVKVISTGSNVGSAAGRNRGIEAVSGEYVIFLDDDCILESAWAAESVAAQFQADPKCGAIAFRILDPLVGEWPYTLVKAGEEAAPSVREVMLFCAGGFAARLDALREVGGFWEPLFMGQVDTDLALRIVNAGWRIVGRGDIVVYHPAPDRAAPLNVRREIYSRARNSLWVAVRLMPVGLWPPFLGLKLWRAFSLAVRLGELPLFFHALLDASRRLSECLAERRPLQGDVVRRARRQGMKLWF